MSEDIKDFHEIIAESFLSDADKRTLDEQLDNSGPTEAFVVNLNELLTKGLKQLGGVYEKFVANFEVRFGELEGNYQSQRQELDNALDIKLLGVNPTDVAKKEVIFSEYYANVHGLRDQYEKSLKALYSNIFSSAMRELS